MLQVLLSLAACLLFTTEHDLKCFIMLHLCSDDVLQLIVGYVNSFVVLS